jgi:hypothetical protein
MFFLRRLMQKTGRRGGPTYTITNKRKSIKRKREKRRKAGRQREKGEKERKSVKYMQKRGKRQCGGIKKKYGCILEICPGRGQVGFSLSNQKGMYCVSVWHLPL